MEIFADAFALPKAGNAADEYEDACHPHKSVHNPRVEGFRCAVADGATESAFAGEWARLIAKAYCKGRIQAQIREKMLEPVRAKWRQCTQRSNLPWYAEQKLASGAFAALVGLTIHDGAHRRWDALAIGDCCVFQVRDSRCVAAFPLDSAEAFNNSPFLLCSHSMAPGALASHLQRFQGTWEPGDVFYLMSDALAAWFLRAIGAAEQPWAALNDFGTERELENFEVFIAGLRRDALLKNDDVTLLRVACYDTSNRYELAHDG